MSHLSMMNNKCSGGLMVMSTEVRFQELWVDAESRWQELFFLQQMNAFWLQWICIWEDVHMCVCGCRKLHARAIADGYVRVQLHACSCMLACPRMVKQKQVYLISALWLSIISVNFLRVRSLISYGYALFKLSPFVNESSDNFMFGLDSKNFQISF